MALANWTDAQIRTQLVSGYKWSSSIISYSFPKSVSGMNIASGEATGFRAFSLPAQSSAKLALVLWDDLISPDFRPITRGSSNIEFGFTTTGIGRAHAYYPTGGSVWFNPNDIDLLNPVIGKSGFNTYIHELGHALGLDHMGNYNGNQNWTPSSYQDSSLYSIMSYFGPDHNNGSSQVAWADWIGADGVRYYAQTPMLNDIMAIQSIYGAETTRTGDTVYGFNSNVTGQLGNIFNFKNNQNPILTLYDTGGTDTLDLSGWGTHSNIDLTPGSFSSVNSMTNNLAIARNTLIEIAIGGSANDTILGNTADNTLIGNAGNDTLRGENGNDRLIGGVGQDALYGGNGLDWFIFDTTPSNSNLDTIYDFKKGQDKVVLDDDIFTRLTGTANGAALNPNNFVTGVRALDANDFIIFNTANKTLYYDADANGSVNALPIAVLIGQTLSATDILVIA